MDPVPETVDVLHRLRQTERDPRVMDGLAQLTNQVQRLVPSCTGVSIGMSDSGLTLTWVASSSAVATMDAIQYLAEAATDDDTSVDVVRSSTVDDPTDEEQWRLISLAHGTVGEIQSSLTIPLVEHETVIGAVNFYATSPDAFEGRRDQLAELCGAWAPGAILNADLTFSSRLRAAAAPAILDDQERVDQATGIVCEVLGVTPEEARTRIRSAAARAGVTESHLARTVIESRHA